jgi:hypothetical protein
MPKKTPIQKTKNIKKRISKTTYLKTTDFNNIIFPKTTDSKKQQIPKNNKCQKTTNIKNNA